MVPRQRWSLAVKRGTRRYSGRAGHPYSAAAMYSEVSNMQSATSEQAARGELSWTKVYFPHWFAQLTAHMSPSVTHSSSHGI